MIFNKKTEDEKTVDCNCEPAPQPEPKANEMTFTFILKSHTPDVIRKLLDEDEEIIGCYKTIRDYAVFTSKKLIIRDIKGVTGTKVETLIIPYRSIRMFSVESAGLMGFDSDVYIWTNAINIRLHLDRNIDAEELSAIIATKID